MILSDLHVPEGSLFFRKTGQVNYRLIVSTSPHRSSVLRSIKRMEVNASWRFQPLLDRVIQQAIAQVLTPIFDPDFSNNSFGFRPRRNAQQAVKQVQGIIKDGRRIAVDVDLSKFFDRVNHNLLMTHLGYKVKDKYLLKLIRRYLQAGVIDNQGYSESREGVPQGGPLSPLLTNIMLDPLDKELEERGHRFTRYADDVTILVKSQCAGERVLLSIGKYLQNRLMLMVNMTKVRLLKPMKASSWGLPSRQDAFNGTRKRC